MFFQKAIVCSTLQCPPSLSMFLFYLPRCYLILGKGINIQVPRANEYLQWLNFSSLYSVCLSSPLNTAITSIFYHIWKQHISMCVNINIQQPVKLTLAFRKLSTCCILHPVASLDTSWYFIYNARNGFTPMQQESSRCSMNTSCFSCWQCSRQGPVLGKNIDTFSPPAADKEP